MTVLYILLGVTAWLLVGYATARFMIWFDKKDGFESLSVGEAYLFTFCGPLVTILLVLYFFVVLVVKIIMMVHGHFKRITA